MTQGSGLSSREALLILIEECENVLEKWKETGEGRPRQRFPFGLLHNPSKICTFHLLALLVVALLVAVGAVDLENVVSYLLLAFAFVLFGYTVLVTVCISKKSRQKEDVNVRKLKELVVYLKNTKNTFCYSSYPEPLTEDMWGQYCIRNGHAVNVPKIMLVRGDLLLLRPGQTAPCSCIDETGLVYQTGQRVEMDLKTDWKTGGSVELVPLRATCTESLITNLVVQCLEKKSSSSKLADQVNNIYHTWFERYILIPYACLVIMVVTLRYYYSTSESYFGTRFVFSIPGLIILPLLAPTLPIIMELLHCWNNQLVADSLGVAYEHSDKDYLDIFARLTGVSVIDKKGVLSSGNPCMDKVIVMKLNSEFELVPETMGLSSELQPDGKWKLYFDDPSWEEHANALRPLGLNLQLNSCLYNQQYISFLDHLSVVSPLVPRTIVTANRRCMCQFPQILGFDSSSCLQFQQSEPKTLGFYKRQPGEAPLHGLNKHRTPMEMAFCTVHSDVTSRHSHVSCQGTADVILDACTHVWNGLQVIPLSARLSRQVRDIYQRNSMTGYCLLLSYRPTDCTLSSDVNGHFFELPLARELIFDGNVRVRSLSTENIPEKTKELRTSEEVIENVLSGQILCGLVAMQYEALPQAVQLVDSLESNCIRFVYFSRENELRSRVFAEKLGLEAGWNCHISLAEPVEEREDSRPLQDVFMSSILHVKDDWDKPSQLNKGFLSKSEAYLLEEPTDKRVSPFRRLSSVCSVKVGAMPNKAQLPTGVSRVRPHLEEVDNVPLLVSLFTDCDSEVNKEMLKIMQENDEVVLIIGSSLNTANIGMFLQSDVSVTVPPFFDPNCSFLPSQPPTLHATDLAARILSTATDFELDHDQLLNISATVAGSRNRLASLKHSLLFVLMSSVQLSMLIFLSTISVLPLIFTTAQIFLVVFLQIPLLFIATACTPFVPKNTVIKIAPKLEENSTMLCSYSDVVCSFGDEMKMSTEEIRHIVGLHFVIYLLANSIAWVYPLTLFCWPPGLAICSPPWLICSGLCLTLQVGYSYLSGIYLHRLISVPSILLSISWMIILAIINEICKLRSIRTFLREQRRTKLAFDTKLGMNSPY